MERENKKRKLDIKNQRKLKYLNGNFRVKKQKLQNCNWRSKTKVIDQEYQNEWRWA